MSKKIRTIYDLAELAGVSAATVSRALAGKDVVNSDTAERIRKLAQTHDFTPSALARNLRIRRRGAIGVVIPLGHERAQHISDPFFMTMIGGLADELTERGFDLVLSRVLPDRKKNWLRTMIDADRVDGVIVIGQSDQSAVLDEVAARYLPLVAWGGFAQGQIHCSVGTDNFLGGRIAVQHLIERGCRRIAFFGNPGAIEIAQRLEGARTAAAAATGVTLSEIPTHLAADLSAAEITQFFDSSSELPDGIFAASDVIAVTVMQVTSLRSIAVPDGIKIVGFDDLPIARGALPPLTTVRQDIATGATQLVELLLKRIDGKATGSVILNPELIIRQST